MRKVKVEFTVVMTDQEAEALKAYKSDAGCDDETLKEFITSYAQSYIENTFLMDRLSEYL